MRTVQIHSVDIEIARPVRSEGNSIAAARPIGRDVLAIVYRES